MIVSIIGTAGVLAPQHYKQMEHGDAEGKQPFMYRHIKAKILHTGDHSSSWGVQIIAQNSFLLQTNRLCPFSSSSVCFNNLT